MIQFGGLSGRETMQHQSSRRRARPARVILTLFTLSLVVVLSRTNGGCRTARNPSTPIEPRESITARVTRVIDGDSIVLDDGSKVRYIGIDTPEKGEPFSSEATRNNEELVEGKTVRLVTGKDPKDQYGRILAYVYVEAHGDEVLVNKAQIRDGFATYYEVSPNISRREELLHAQVEARDDHRGMWGQPNQGRASEDYYLASSRRFHRPSCKSASSIRRPKRLTNRGDGFDQGLSPCRTCKP